MKEFTAKATLNLCQIAPLQRAPLLTAFESSQQGPKTWRAHAVRAANNHCIR